MELAQPESPNGQLLNSNSNSRTAPKEVFVYRDDLVTLKSKPGGLIGIVTEVAGEYDSDESLSLESDISDDEEEEEKEEEERNGKDEGKKNGTGEGESADKRKDYSDSETLPDGQIRVSWLDHTFSSEDLSSVTVIDRAFLHGDLVTSVADPSGQLGQVTDIHISIDLLNPNSNQTLKSVSSQDLKRVRDFVEGDFVISNYWLGRVDEVLDNVTVLFDDGSVCKVIRADPLKLKPVLIPLVDDVRFPYYPGQRVKAVNSSVFKSQRFLSGLWKASRLEGVVVKVETVAVNVYWIASAYFGPNQLEGPEEEQSPKNLTLVSGFRYAGWQFGDWCHLAKPIKEFVNENEECGLNGEDNVEENGGEKGEEKGGENEENSLDENEVATQQNSVLIHQQNNSSSHENVTAGYRKKLKKVLFRKVDKRARKKDEIYEKALEIVRTETKVDVIWQDGRKEYNVDAKSLIRIHTPNDNDFLPDQLVVEREGEESHFMKNKQVGLVKSVNAKDRTVLVRWLKDFGLEASSEAETEMVSAYELDLHPDYDYCYGDVVVRLPPVTHDTHSVNQKINEGVNGEESNNESEDLANNFAWAGNIVGFCDGSMEVVWADGSKSMVGPHEVYVVGREDGESFDGASVGGASWETLLDDDDNDDDSISLDREISIEENMPPESEYVIDPNQIQEVPSSSLGPLSIPLAAIGFMTRLASDFFSRGKKNLPQEESEIPIVEKSESEGNEDEREEERDEEEEEEERESVEGEENEGFKHFDVLRLSPGDHHFLDTVGNGGVKKWVRKVQQEWNILEKNLPEDIYVRVFEDRMDLIRAVIVGVPGTPYQDGLFFFDILLPSDFPLVPPSTYYHSGGLRLNPNLYADGKVCLSLLNTWTGKGNEVWDPSSSTILQVLVSIQGLVLNEKPYFNEAGYEKQVGTVEGEKNVMPYNENTYLLNLKSMLYLIRKPPLHFEEFVRDHFKSRGYYILKACRAYMDGCGIGSLSAEACPTESSSDNSCSVGFKLTLTKLLPRLFAALKQVGAQCCEFEYLLNNNDNNNQ